VNFPVECDDEFWENEDPKKAFKQPDDKPSYMAYWTVYLRLMHIMGMVLASVVSMLILRISSIQKLHTNSIPSASQEQYSGSQAQKTDNDSFVNSILR
jgi:hypothetical protein